MAIQSRSGLRISMASLLPMTLSRERTPLPMGGAGVRGLGASVKGQTQVRANPSEDGIEVAANLLIREANDPETEFSRLRSALNIVCEPFVLPAVQFDYELGGMTVEINDIAVDWNLMAEFCSVEA